MSRRGIYFALLALVFAVAGTSSANAQQVFGRIFGTVTDASGGAVQNAKVTITESSKGTSSEVTTNDSGNYDKGQLIPGNYTVTVEAAGFAKQQFSNISVLVDAAARIDASLQPGNVTQTVEVTAAAPTLQADRADVQTTFTSQQLVDLPSLGRNAQAMALLTPGTSHLGWNHASSEDPQGSIQIIVNGQHFSATGFQLDGTENQDPILGIVVINPNIDGLAEQKISSQDYDAEFGYVGAGISNSSTKSGTNSWHGSAFDYIRNNSRGFVTSARDPFAEPNGSPVFKQNQFGGSIGGKIIKDKLFFFADAELIRQRQNGSVQTTVPTAAARNGDFSQYLGGDITTDGGPLKADKSNGIPVIDTSGTGINLRANMIFDPSTGAADGSGRRAFANNVIPLTRLSPQALRVQNYLPLPNLAAANPLLPNYAASGGVAFDANKWDTREDYYLNESTQIFGRYSNHQFEKSGVGAFGSINGGPAFNGVNFAGNSFSRDQSIAFGLTHTFSPTVVNEFRFGYMKYYVNVTPNGVGQRLADQIGIPGLNTDNYYTTGLPYFDLGVTSLGYSLGANQCNCPLTENEQQYQFTDNVSKINGNHTYKFGVDLRFASNLRVPSDSHRAGELTFNKDNTGYVTGGQAQQGLNFATLLLGNVTKFSRYVSSSTNATEHQRRWFFYGQDSWRVNPKLTVNYGLRWETVFPETVNGAGNGAQLDLSTGLINVFGVGKVSGHGVQNMNWANFAPRIGVAYQLNSKTVVRTGYGWAYSLGTFGATFGHNVTQNPPVLFNQTPSSLNGASFNSVFTLAQGAPSAVGLFPTGTQAYQSTGQFALPDNVGAKARPSDVRLPRVMAYNFTVERQIFANTSLSVGYVGNSGRHVSSGSGNGYDSDVNTKSFDPRYATINQNLSRPYFTKYGWTQGISYYCMCLNNEYNSLQVQLKRATAGGYGVQASYTYQSAKSVEGNDYEIYYNRALGWGQEDGLPNHQFTFAQNYDIPFGKGRKYGASMNKFAEYAVGGWNISGVTIFYGGLPFTPSLSNTTTTRPYTGPSSRPDIGSGSAYANDKNRDHWLAVGTGAYAQPAANTFGNYGVNTLRGPIFINQDVTLQKSFPITEKMKWTLRGEAYNLFNHTNLNLPNNNVNGSNPGVITGIAAGSNMRRLQFAARFDF